MINIRNVDIVYLQWSKIIKWYIEKKMIIVFFLDNEFPSMRLGSQYTATYCKNGNISWVNDK